jgi:hypothetical protein
MTFKTVFVVASVAVAVTLPGRIHADDDPLDALNRVIQQRFAGIDRFFGMRRIVVLGDTPHQFKPETVSEESVVQDLRDAKLKVALYMAGRRVLDREPNLASDLPTKIDRRVIFGPVAVTDVAQLRELPHSVDLIDEARGAFEALQRRDRHDFNVENWKFSARAVRVAGNECVTCHKGHKTGDPLGVVLYAYR